MLTPNSGFDSRYRLVETQLQTVAGYTKQMVSFCAFLIDKIRLMWNLKTHSYIDTGQVLLRHHFSSLFETVKTRYTVKVCLNGELREISIKDSSIKIDSKFKTFGSLSHNNVIPNFWYCVITLNSVLFPKYPRLAIPGHAIPLLKSIFKFYLIISFECINN